MIRSICTYKSKLEPASAAAMHQGTLFKIIVFSIGNSCVKRLKTDSVVLVFETCLSGICFFGLKILDVSVFNHESISLNPTPLYDRVVEIIGRGRNSGWVGLNNHA